MNWRCQWNQSLESIIACGTFIQRRPGPIQKDAIQLCTGEMQFGHKEATKCTEVGSQKRKIMVIVEVEIS